MAWNMAKAPTAELTAQVHAYLKDKFPGITAGQLAKLTEIALDEPG